MITTKRKAISILLAIMMMVAIAPPAFAFAEETPADGTATVDQQVPEAASEDGEVTLMGTTDGEPSHDIADYTFKLSQDKFFYNGKPQKPDVICEEMPEDAYYVEYQIDQGDWYDGTFEVYIYGNDAADYYGNVTLEYQIVVTTIDLNKYSATLYRKGTVQLKATVHEPNGKTKWTSSNTKVATVSSTGKVTAKAKGTATIKAKNGNAWETAKITVKNPKLNATASKLYVKGTKTLKITGKVGKATFKSSNKKIATVSSSGKIKAKKKGKCTITVKTNGRTLKCKVKVKNPPPVRVYITRTGKRYHCDPDCWGLRNARAVWKVTLSKAKKKGLTKCHVCYY